MANFTNAELAQKMSDLILYWSDFNEEYANWLAGAADGGPSSDGKFPLTNYLGVESLLDSPASLASGVGTSAAASAASAAAALVSELAAAQSDTDATAQAVIATAQAALADADRIAAAAHESGAVDAKVVAIAQAAVATANAILTAADVVLTNADVVLTAADAVQTALDVIAAAASAAAAAASAASIPGLDDDVVVTGIRGFATTSSQASLRVILDDAVSTPPTQQAGWYGKMEWWDNDQTDLMGHIGYHNSGTLEIFNKVREGRVTIKGTQADGTEITMVTMDPDDETEFYYGGNKVMSIVGPGQFAIQNGTDDTVRKQIQFAYLSGSVRGEIGLDSSGTMLIYNRIHGGDIIMELEDSGGDDFNVFNANETWTRMYNRGTAQFMQWATDIIGVYATTTFELRDGCTFKVMDAGDTDYMEMWHNGSAFYYNYVNTSFVYHHGVGTTQFNRQENAATEVKIGEGTTPRGGSQSSRFIMYGDYIGTIYSAEFENSANAFHIGGGATNPVASIEMELPTNFTSDVSFGSDFVYDPDGGTDDSGTFPTLNLGNGTFAAGEANLHIDHITAAGEANEFLFILASNGSPRFTVQRDGDMTFYSKIQIPGGTALQWSGANTRIVGYSSAAIEIRTHDDTIRGLFDDDGLEVTGALAVNGVSNDAYPLEIFTTADGSTPSLRVNDANGRVFIGGITGGAALNVLGTGDIWLDGNVRRLDNVSTIRSYTSGASALTIDTTNLRVGGSVGSARIDVVAPTGGTLPGIAIAESASGQPLISMEDYLGNIGLQVNFLGLQVNDNLSGIYRFEMFHFMTPSSTDGDGTGISLAAENASGSKRNIAYWDAYYSDISADEVIMKWGIRPGSADADPVDVMTMDQDGNLTVGGLISSGNITVGNGKFRVLGTNDASDPPVSSDPIQATFDYYDAAGVEVLGTIGFPASNGSMDFRNNVEAGSIGMRATQTGGTLVNMVLGQPNGAVLLYYNGGYVFSTKTNGIEITSVTTDNVLIEFDNSSHQRVGYIQAHSTNGFRINGEVNGDPILLAAHNDAGTSIVALTMNTQTLIADFLTLSVEAVAFNGVALSTAGASTVYLDGEGNYTTPAGGGGSDTPWTEDHDAAGYDLTDVGKYTATDNVNINGAVNADARLTVTHTGASGPTSGGGIRVVSDDGGPVASGHRLGLYGFGGAWDSSGGISFSAQIVAYAAQTFNGTDRGTQMELRVTPLDSTVLTTALTLQNDLSADFAGDIDVTGLIMASGKEAIDGSDTWLRLNNNGDFSAGVYIADHLRVDNNILSYGTITIGDTSNLIGGAGDITGFNQITLAEPSSGLNNAINLISTGPGMFFLESDAASNEGGYKLYVSSGNLNLYTTTDAGAATQKIFQVERGTGTAVDVIQFDVNMNIAAANSLTVGDLGVPHHVTTGYVGGDITVSSSAPGSPTKGDIWFDTT